MYIGWVDVPYEAMRWLGCVDAGVVNVLREGGVDYNGRGGGACVGAGNRSRASKVRFTRAVPRAADRWAARIIPWLLWS